MKGMTLAALAGAILLCGCASTDNNPTTGQNTVASREDAPLGSFIKKKPGSGSDSVTLDKQALENQRMMNSSPVSLPQR